MRLRLLLGLAPGPALLLGGAQTTVTVMQEARAGAGASSLTGHTTEAYAAPWLPPTPAARRARRRRQEAELLLIA